jgi:hypothetical protein
MTKMRSPKRKPKIDDWDSLTPAERNQLWLNPNWRSQLTPNAQKQLRGENIKTAILLINVILFGILVFAQCTRGSFGPTVAPSATPSASECNRFVSTSEISDYLTVIEPNVYGFKDGFALLDTVVIAKVQNERFDQRFFNVTLSGAAWNRIVTVSDLITELEAALCAP